MTPTQLQQIFKRLPPGQWYCDVNHVIRTAQQVPEVPEYFPRVTFTSKEDRNNQEAIVALRNHASALIECAKLLTPIRALLSEGEGTYHREINGPECDRLYELIDAALKRLEEIK